MSTFHKERSDSHLDEVRRGVVTTVYRSGGYEKPMRVESVRWEKTLAPYIDKMRQELMDWSGNGRPNWHECTHVSHETEKVYPSFFRHASEFVLSGKAHLSRAYSYDYYRWSLAAGYLNIDQVPAPPEVHPQLDWGTAWEALLDDISGLMPTDMSVGLNIAEFTQLKRLVPSLAKSINNIIRYVRRQPNKKVTTYKYLFDKKTGKRIAWTAERQTVKLHSLSWCLKDLADLHLGISFGALPLADDVGNWVSKLYQVQQHLNWYRVVADGGWHRFRSRTPQYDTQSTVKTSGTEPEFSLRYEGEQKTSVTSVGVIHAAARVRPKTGSGFVSGLMAQVLGINAPFHLAWELVPFSFVVDWFLPVGRLIDRVEPRRALGSITKQFEIGSVWCSQKTTSTVRRSLTQLSLASDRWDVALTEPGSFSRTWSCYQRLHRTPAYTVLPSGKTRYGVRQFLLTGSLLGQRALRGKKFLSSGA
jgi:hypothetical protein